jgi:hypothetical protein
MKQLVKKPLSKCENTQVIVSCGTPRADSSKHNSSVKLVNAILENEFADNTKVKVCFHNNMTRRGEPNRELLDDDGIHLTPRGTSVLAGNLKHAVDTVLLISHSSSTSKLASGQIRNNTRRNDGRSGYHQDKHGYGSDDSRPNSPRGDAHKQDNTWDNNSSHNNNARGVHSYNKQGYSDNRQQGPRRGYYDNDQANYSNAWRTDQHRDNDLYFAGSRRSKDRQDQGHQGWRYDYNT